jgi:hypothetical protein
MKKSVILLAIGAMALLMVAAVAWDSMRLASGGHHRVALADAEMQKQEKRLVKLLSGSKQVSSEVQIAMVEYAMADNMQARHAAYDKLVAGFRQTMSGDVDPTNPLDRRFMDDIAGAINRREVAEKQYDVEWAAYREALSGFRGRVARLLSARARADWESNQSDSDLAIKVEKEP